MHVSMLKSFKLFLFFILRLLLCGVGKKYMSLLTQMNGVLNNHFVGEALLNLKD